MEQLPEDPSSLLRTESYLGLLSGDLKRAFADATGGIPLAPASSRVVADAAVAELQAVGVPAALVPRRSRLQSVAGMSLKVGMLAALLCAVGNVIVDGLGGMVATIPEWLLLYGLVIPVAITFVVALIALPTALITGVIGALRRREQQSMRQRSGQNVAELAQRGVRGRAVEVDAKARELARNSIRAQLPLNIEQDILKAIEEGRQGLRRVEEPPEDVLVTIEGELDALGEALNGFHSRGTTADDASAPLANLRRTAQALRQTPS